MIISETKLSVTFSLSICNNVFGGLYERGQGNIIFFCSADRVQDWQSFTRLILTLAICVTIHTGTMAI